MNKIAILFLGIIFFFGCTKEESLKVITIKNSLNVTRQFETIELTKDFLGIDNLDDLGIKDISTGKVLVSQTIDLDGDKISDQLIFQPTINPNSEKKFAIIEISEEEKPKSIEYCYSRFVPERTDDYAWENNKVAFRTFGPRAQKMIEENIKGGTLSSGIDAWLKRVDYPIINKWYKKELETDGSYHKDNGEGLDNFHVGVSRGVGGIAVKSDDTFYYSRNFTKWKTITTGPLRTSFQLVYATWDANGKKIEESKTISLDYGSNLSKFEVNIKGTETVATGLTLHEKDGEVSSNKDHTWTSYWQPHKDSELGTAIITTQKYFNEFEKYDTEAKDESNAYLHLNVIDNKVAYYAGFAWKKSNQFENKKQWEAYLISFAEKIKSPLVVSHSN